MRGRFLQRARSNAEGRRDGGQRNPHVKGKLDTEKRRNRNSSSETVGREGESKRKKRDHKRCLVSTLWGEIKTRKQRKSL